MLPYVCYTCKYGDFDAYNPSKMGICLKHNKTIRAKKSCDDFEEEK